MPRRDAIARPARRGGMRGVASRHPRIVLAWTVIGLVAGLVYGRLQPVGHVAEAQLLVGTFEAPAAAVPGYVLASQNVAQNYARLATSSLVVDQAAAQLGVSSDEVRGTIAVSAVPDSAIVRVVATGGSEDEAREAAEAMSSVLSSTVAGLNTPASGDDVLEEYQKAQTELSVARQAQQTAQRQFDQATGADPIAAAQATLDQANLAANIAQLKVDGLARQYLTVRETVSTSSQIRSLGGAEVSGESTLVPTVLDAVVGGAIGAVIGLLLGWRRDRRARAARRRADGGPSADGERVGSGTDGGREGGPVGERSEVGGAQPARAGR